MAEQTTGLYCRVLQSGISLLLEKQKGGAYLGPTDILCGHSSYPHYLHGTDYKTMPALLYRLDSTDCHVIEDTHMGSEKFMVPCSGTTVITNTQTH